MKAPNTGHKIHINPTARKNIPPDKNVMRRVQGGQAGNVDLKLLRTNEQFESEDWHMDGITSRLTYSSEIDWAEAEFAAQARADGGSGRTSVNLGANGPHALSLEGNGSDADIERRPVLDEIIDRLSGCDLGPGGFFVICHHGHQPLS